MARAAKVEVTGQADVKKAFGALSLDVKKEVQAVIRESADEVRREARSRIPVSRNKNPKNPYPSGTTRRKVFRKVAPDGLSAEVGNKWFVARFLEHGTVKMSARPWLFPSWELVRPKIVKRIESALTGIMGFHGRKR